MKKNIRIIAICLVVVFLAFALAGCIFDETTASGQQQDKDRTYQVAGTLQNKQPTPTDIEYSLERYNLIRRAYWVNGQREKAATVECPMEKPLGYIVLFAGNATVGSFVVDGKVSSLNSYLTPDSEFYELAYGGTSTYGNKWLADVDGSYGANDDGIFFFTPDGKYIEWTGDYLYSDIPFSVSTPIVTVSEAN